ncbi:MAG: PQQ-binding-like beta-propeller repeat protein [Planctomycetes bacterium]|nr:PQQ-binding-like beta-propeller repeat protein [Planctomycetota bacterium]
MRNCFTLMFVLCAATVSPAADNWPQFRGPTGDGHAVTKGLPTKWSESENVRWKTPIHGKGWSSPVIWGDQIWLTTVKEKYADDAPKENAQKKIPRPDYIEMYAICVDKTSGKIVHDILLRKQDQPDYCHSYNSYGTPTPVVEEGRVYLHFGSHGTFCIDSKTGKTIWERVDLKCDHFRGPGSSPIIRDNLIFLTFDGYDQQYVTALNTKDGTTAWKKDRIIKYTSTNADLYKAYSTPSIFEIDGKLQLISPSAEATIAYDPKSGDEIWRVHHGGMNAACKPVYGHNLIFLSSGHTANVLALKQGGKGMIPKEDIVWKTIKAGPSRPSFLLVDDLLFTVSDNGFASCVDAKTGTQHWQERLGGAFCCSPTLAEGRIYISDQDLGKTHVFAAAKEYKPIAVNSLDAGCMATSAFVGDAIYMRTKTHLYCIGKK